MTIQEDIAAQKTGFEFVEHFGTKGMRWGVRRGKGKTGLTRHRGALLDRNARRTSVTRKMLAGKKYRASMAVGKAFMGKEAQTRRLNTSITDMNKQSKRIKAGKLTIEDRMDILLTTSLSDLVISRTPR